MYHRFARHIIDLFLIFKMYVVLRICACYSGYSIVSSLLYVLCSDVFIFIFVLSYVDFYIICTHTYVHVCHVAACSCYGPTNLSNVHPLCLKQNMQALTPSPLCTECRALASFLANEAVDLEHCVLRSKTLCTYIALKNIVKKFAKQ